MLRSTVVFRVALVLSTSALVAACSSKSSDTGSSSGVGATSTAAAVAGPADTHCVGTPVVVDPTVCLVAPAADDAGAADAGGAGGGGPMAEFGATLYNAEGDDDDCKYHVKWQSTTVAANTDVTFSLSATTRSDNKPLTAAKPYAELYLSDTHGAPNTPVATTEVSPGNYTIGPVRFDARGKWTVRFHFRADCDDSPTSPHGHIAFFVNMP